MKFLRAAIREQLLHFVLIGAVLFAFTALRQQKQEHAEIRITRGEVAQLAAFWETQAQRKPTAEELRGLKLCDADQESLAKNKTFASWSAESFSSGASAAGAAGVCWGASCARSALSP